MAALALATVGCGANRALDAETCSPTLYRAVGGVSDGVLRDIDLSDASDVWAVGGAPYFDEESSLVLRWDGDEWSRIESPSDIWYYRAVAVVGTDDVWAVGREGKSFGEARVTHWDGESWSEPTFPAADEASTVSVDGSSPDDVWVGGATGGAFGPAKPYLTHWDGTAWRAVPLKSAVLGEVTELSAVATDDVWGIVSVYDETTGEELPSLVIHWDGKEWAQIPGPGQELGLLTAVAADDVWVTSGDALHHWDGRNWTTVIPPYSGLSVYGLDHAEAFVWITASDHLNREVVARFDGTTWSQADLPEPTLGPDYRGVAAVSGTAAWAVGAQHRNPVHAPAAQLSCIAA